MKYFRVCSYLAIALAGLQQQAQAVASAGEEAAETGNTAETEPGTIVVTALRRAESVQDVPLSITSMGEEQLQRSSIMEFVDYGTRIPSLSFGSTGDGAAGARTIAIRGVSGENTTGFYIDETPVPDSVDPKIVDVERIEVLRGPQGTLYGARSLGGTVRLITKQPSDEGFSGSARGALSSTKEGGWNYRASGTLNLPLAPGAALRVSGLYEHESGIFDRVVEGPTTPQPETHKNVDSGETYGFQVALKLEPVEDLTITPRILYQRTARDGFPFADYRPDNFTQHRYFNNAEYSRDRWTLYTTDVQYDADFGSFTSSTSYFDRSILEREDQSEFYVVAFGLTTPLSGIATQRVPYKRFVQEVRFVSDFAGPFQLILGGFYSHLKSGEAFDPPAAVPGLDAALGGMLGTDNAFSGIRKTRTEEPAFYGEASYALTDKLKLTGGLRWYSISIDDRYDYDGFFVGGPGFLELKTKETGVNPKLLVEYKATRDHMVYASAARGFRPGGLNLMIPDLLCGSELTALGLTRDQIAGYKADSLWSYEIGAKTSWFNRRLTVNAAAYRLDWPDVQQIQNLQCGFSFTGNAGKAVNKGFELEVHASPTDALSLDFGLGYVDAKFTEASSTLAAPVGTRLFQTPRWTISGSAHWQKPITGDVEGFAHVDGSYVGSSLSSNNPDLSADPAHRYRTRPSYTLVDFRFGVAIGKTEIAAFAKNLTNEHVNFADNRSLAAETPGRPRIVTNRPRTIGLEVKTAF